MPEYSIKFPDISLTTNDLFYEMGYQHIEPDEQIVAYANAQLEILSDIVIPKCAFEFYTECGLQTGSTISSLLEGAEYFALFAATAGMAFHNYQEALKAENDILKSFIVDTIGTCIVEKTGDYLERLLEKEIGDARHTNRFSPGYCGWHLSGQKELFALLGGNPCDIQLSDVFLMTPIKSISGVIGIGREVNEKKYGCQYCELETCYKKKRYDKNK